MPTSRWSMVCKSVRLSVWSAAILFSLTAHGSASTNLARSWNAPPVPKSCSGAFRYAARVGNVDIIEISPVQAFARERRLARISYTGRGIYDVDSTVSRQPLLTAMCG